MADKKENEEGKSRKEEVKKSDNKNKENSKSNSSKLKWILSTLVFVVIIVGAFSLTKYVLLPISRKYQMKRQIKEKAQAEDKKIPGMGLVYLIDDLAVNTLGSNGYRIVVAELILESKEKAVIEEIEKREPQFRDVFIKYFRSHTDKEISNLSFQEKSRSDLIKIANERLNSGVIDSLYYVKLILQ